MQHKRFTIAALICACLVVSGCGQPLVTNPAGNSAAIQTATPGAPTISSSAASVGNGSIDVPSVEASIASTSEAAVPEASNPSVASSDAPPPPVDAPAITPTVNPTFAGVSLPPVQERWRYIQLDRQPFDAVRTYTATTPQTLWWYNPVFGRNVRLGDLQGEFPVQATFRFRGQEANGLEVPYQVGQSFGFSLPAATLQQMRDAGVSEWAETFVYESPNIQPK